MRKFLLVCMIAVANLAISQVGIRTGVPDVKAMLEVAVPQNDKGISKD